MIFLHHSTGEAWLADDHGGLGIALRDNHYFVSDSNYGWGPSGIGDQTDIGHWWLWFRGPSSASIMTDVYAESGQHCNYSRLTPDLAGLNQIIMFKSCFPNSALQGAAGDTVPAIDVNPLRGEDCGSSAHTVANAKGIYIDLLAYFATMPSKLFVVITAPPLSDATWAGNARAFNEWLVNDWLDNYSGNNVFVWDFYNVLTSNAGDSAHSDVGLTTGHHHRWWQGNVQHLSTGGGNTLAYASAEWDDHPNAVGDQKATAEFIPLLNAAVNAWNAVPRLTVAECRAGAIHLTMDQLSIGATYDLERCADLQTGGWTGCASFQCVSTPTNWSEPVQPTWKSMFYRLKRR